MATLAAPSRFSDSQSSNPGSIPGSATNYIRQSPLIQRVLFLPKKVGGALCPQKALPMVHKMVHRDFDPKKAGFSTPKSTLLLAYRGEPQEPADCADSSLHELHYGHSE